MPPRVKITKEKILETALELVRQKGCDAVNARAIAAMLGCSTQPVFSNFATMEELEKGMLAAAYTHYLSFLEKEVKNGKYPPYKSFGRGYIRFASEEPELFRLLFMRDREKEDQAATPADFEASVEMIMQANGLSHERATLLHMEMWAAVHGIATMLATSFLSLDEEMISHMISDIYLGISAKLRGEEEDEQRH